jgi:hypothetical protein
MDSSFRKQSYTDAFIYITAGPHECPVRIHPALTVDGNVHSKEKPAKKWNF